MRFQVLLRRAWAGRGVLAGSSYESPTSGSTVDSCCATSLYFVGMGSNLRHLWICELYPSRGIRKSWNS